MRIHRKKESQRVREPETKEIQDNQYIPLENQRKSKENKESQRKIKGNQHNLNDFGHKTRNMKFNQNQ